ncbi:hypothetical protein ACFX2F_028125 [Malus domestica]
MSRRQNGGGDHEVETEVEDGDSEEEVFFSLTRNVGWKNVHLLRVCAPCVATVEETDWAMEFIHYSAASRSEARALMMGLHR